MKNNPPSRASEINHARRRLLKGTVASSALLGLNLAGWGPSLSLAQSARRVTLLDPSSQEKFVNPLPLPKRLYMEEGDSLVLPIVETEQWVGLKDPNGNQLTTTFYGFEYEDGTGSPGPTIVTRQNQNISVEFQNQLPNNKPPIFPVDTSLHVPHIDNFDQEKPVVIHLHGGHTEPDSDGNPLAWYTQNYQSKGEDFVKQTYDYDNTQEACCLWYHDHTVGMTRLNVYGGLAGFYLIKDENEDRLIAENIIPNDSNMIELVISDALFDDQGNLYNPGSHGQPINPIIQKEIQANWPNPTVLDEFFGNFIMVNGMTWPKHEVEPTRYRLRLLNGSSSRSYVLEFENGMEFYQIGSDGGFLDSPVRLTQLVITPAERMDIVIDFTEHAGEQIILKNLGPELPFRGYVDPEDPEDSMKLVYNDGGDLEITDGTDGLAPIAPPDTSGVIMRFDVGANEDSVQPQATNFTPAVELRTPLVPLPRDNPAVVRQLPLFNLRDDIDRTIVLLGTMDRGSLFFMDEITEIIEPNTVEIWEIYNTTGSAHPIHVHQVQFEILNRQEFDGDLMMRDQQLMDTGRTFQGATLDFHGLKGDPVPPQPNEQGRKDTALALAGQVTRLIMRFDTPGQYVWHCHIITHEDYDMMRKLEVRPVA